MRGIVLVAVVAFAACGKSPEPAADPYAASKAAAVAALLAQMKDPTSVQTQNIVAVRRGKWDYVCGEYNAKNGFGGYVGFTKFAWRSNGDLGIGVEGEPAYVYEFGKACAAGDSLP